ncbi:MAG: hypothetical protein HQL33_04595 [Alphaproteobacteria bacterium]|nr:hypothetical protein [Alphaproteobacteria bacterium]
MVVRRQDVSRSRFMAALSYMGVLVFVPLLMNKDDEFVYFHAKQGLVLWTWSVFGLFGLHLPGVGKWWFSFSAMMVFGYSLIGLASVLFSRAWKLPVIYTLSTKL